MHSERTQRRIFIVGGAGYVGEMLCDQFAKRDDVEAIIALDKEPRSDFSKQIPKLTYIQANMADNGWQEQVRAFAPDTVIHTAWQIRAMYRNANKQWRWNVEGSDKVFDLAFNEPSVTKLIYFSTASSYGARSENTFDHRFSEDESFRDDNYIYAKEKKVVEEHLREKYEKAKETGEHAPQIFVVRPAAITGPRGRYMRMRFGLQSALEGNLEGGPVYKLVTALTSFVPATKGWVRQFIHEDDVADFITQLTFEESHAEYEVYNLTPTSEPVYAKDMARAVGKRILPVYPWMVWLAFTFFWHATRGKVPTSPGSWRFYSYPLLMSGEKLAGVYRCKYSSKEAFQYTDGRYESLIPGSKRRPNPNAD